MKKFYWLLLAALLVATGASPAEAVEYPNSGDALQFSAATDAIIVPSSSQLPVEVSYAGDLSDSWTSNSSEFSASMPDASLTATQESKGSAQFKIRILNSEAPSEYPFLFTQNGEILQPQLNRFGAVDLLDQEGNYVAFVLTPWAKSNDGQTVPTEFKVEGRTLIQVVSFKSLTSITYPIEADPYLGIDLISSVYANLNTSGTAYNLKIAVTPWAGVLYVMYPTAFANFSWPYVLSGGTYGVYLMQTYGWPEVLSKLEARYSSQFRGYVFSKPTFKNQYDCHALGAPLIFASTIAGFDGSPTWDLEGHRYSTSDLGVWVSSRCNW